MIVFAVENFSDAVEEYEKLAFEHWKETDHFKWGHVFNPDKKRYQHYNEIGMYFLFTVRDEGRLVGDAGIYVTPSMHTSHLMASEDTWYLLPEYRKGLTAARFYRFIEKTLISMGVVEMMVSSKYADISDDTLKGERRKGVGRLMEYLGFKPIATQYFKEF